MVWNHRVVRREHDTLDPDDRFSYQIHEAYYEDGNRKPYAITLDPVAAYGSTVEELREELERMLRAVKHPVLDYDTREELSPDSTPSPT
jgi:hypothetical protein